MADLRIRRTDSRTDLRSETAAFSAKSDSSDSNDHESSSMNVPTNENGHNIYGDRVDAKTSDHHLHSNPMVAYYAPPTNSQRASRRSRPRRITPTKAKAIHDPPRSQERADSSKLLVADTTPSQPIPEPRLILTTTDNTMEDARKGTQQKIGTYSSDNPLRSTSPAMNTQNRGVYSSREANPKGPLISFPSYTMAPPFEAQDAYYHQQEETKPHSVQTLHVTSQSGYQSLSTSPDRLGMKTTASFSPSPDYSASLKIQDLTPDSPPMHSREGSRVYTQQIKDEDKHKRVFSSPPVRQLTLGPESKGDPNPLAIHHSMGKLSGGWDFTNQQTAIPYVQRKPDESEEMSRFLQNENQFLKAELDRLTTERKEHASTLSSHRTIPLQGSEVGSQGIDHPAFASDNSLMATLDQQQKLVQDSKHRIMSLHQSLLDVQGLEIVIVQSLTVDRFPDAQELSKAISSSIFHARQVRSSVDGIWSNVRIVQTSFNEVMEISKQLAKDNRKYKQQVEDHKKEMQSFIEEQELLVAAYQDVMNRDYEQIRNLSSQLVSAGIPIRPESRLALGAHWNRREGSSDANSQDAAYTSTQSNTTVPRISEDMVSIKEIEMLLGEASISGKSSTKDVLSGRRAHLIANYLRKKVTEIVCQLEVRGGSHKMQYLAERDELVRKYQVSKEQMEDEVAHIQAHVQANLKAKLDQLQKLALAFETVKERLETQARADAEELSSLRRHTSQLELQVAFLKNTGMHAMDADRRKLLAMLYEKDCEIAERDHEIAALQQIRMSPHSQRNASIRSQSGRL